LLLAVALAGCGGDEPSGPGNFPDVRGSWVGQYSVVNCERLTGVDPFFCDELFYFGRSLLLDLNLQQSNSRVFGIAVQGVIEGKIEGTVDMAGRLSLSGQIGVDSDAATTIQAWQTQLVDDSLVGSWVFLVEDNAGAGFGSALVDADLTLVGSSIPTFANCPMERTISQNDLVNAALEAGDCQIENDESYYDVYAVDVSPGDRLRISMSSSDFSPAVFVVDVEERLLAFEGDLADTLEFLALEAVVAERWLIVANSFLGVQLGNYTLTTEPIGGTGTATGIALQRVAPYGQRRRSVDRVASASPSLGPHRESLARAFLRQPGWLDDLK
jgi:hypothetical protein